MMNAADETIMLARIMWDDPQTGQTMELVLPEGATAGIGRLETNEICIKEQHVSRQHAVINYRDGMFLITDLGSANGVYVNDQRLTEPFPLTSGDVIRLYVPILNFSALMDEEEVRQATEHGTVPVGLDGANGQLLITSGPQEGTNIPLIVNSITIGRASSKADWEVSLQDPSVSRPHARLELIDENWVMYDLGSANGSLVNGTPVNEKGRVLRDGDVITMGSTVALFRSA